MKINRFTFNMFGVNSYILWDDTTKDAAIIDPGMINQNEQNLVDNFIQSNKLNLTHLINTHMHIDHSFGIKYISKKYGLKLECNTNDQFLAKHLKEQAQMFGLPITIEDLKIETNLTDGDTILLGNEILNILQVPGHSPGSIVIYAPESSFIISGDVLFNRSIGRTDLPGGDYNQLINAITNKLMILPKDTIVYPGHGPETSIADELNKNPYI